MADDPVEKAAELDDDLTEKFLEGKEISEQEIRTALRKGTIAFKCHPVFCGSALKYVGVQRFLDGVVDYLPAPTDMPPIQGHDVQRPGPRSSSASSTSDDPFCGLAFKIVNDQHGDLTYVRVYSGILEKGSRVLNSNRGKRENISRMFQMHAADRNPIDVAEAGDIVACIGVKEAMTGDTLCSDDDPIILERPTFPEPVISMSIEPKTAADKQKLGEALTTLKREDPTFQASYDEETGQTIIAGMGELHLEILRNASHPRPQGGRDRRQAQGRLQGDDHQDGRRHSRQAREAVGRSRSVRRLHDQHRAVQRHRMTAAMPLEADMLKKLGWEDNIAFENKVFGGTIPKEYIPSVEYGVRMAAKTGVLAHYPLINAKITLTDGSYHQVDSSQIAFELAGQIAFKDAWPTRPA